MKTIIVRELQDQIWNLDFQIALEEAVLKEDYYTDFEKEGVRLEILRLEKEKSKCEGFLEILEIKGLN